MPDLHLGMADQSEAVIDAIATSMDTRASDPEMAAICADYLSRLPGPGAGILEIGCGNGASTEHIVTHLAP